MKEDTKLTFEGKRYWKRPDESVLDALLRGGANVPFSCRKGSCHVCLLKATAGTPDPKSQASLKAALRSHGLFKPCLARDGNELRIERANPACFTSDAIVHDKVELAPGIWRLRLETALDITWRAGQFINLEGPDGAWRSYSIASLRERDYFMDVHVQYWPGGKVSHWVAEALAPGAQVRIQGPAGNCIYDEAMQGRPLLFIATGTGIAPLVGVLQEALLAQHSGPIHLYHGVRDPERHYMNAVLDEIEAQHALVKFTPCVSGNPTPPGARHGRALDAVCDDYSNLAGFVVFLCGNADAVHAARVECVARGVERHDIHADAFESFSHQAPRDKQVLSALHPDPELWQALESGPGLTRILEDFYTRVYQDPRLAPFFHRVTKARAIEKQYEFLRDVFSGSRDFFGLRPFNAHHWMVISDELFDYREALFLDCLKRYGLAESLIRRWSALHERFRRDIVKSTARGLFVDGVEEPLDGYSDEVLGVAALCDGCQREMPAGSRGRMHQRTGEFFCSSCGARSVGASQFPSIMAPPLPQ